MSRRRRAAAASLVATVVAGLAVHRFGAGVPADVAGDALYTVAVYAALVAVVPRVRGWHVAALAAGWCAAVELFQATGVPAVWADTVPAVALVLGRGFDVRDLVVYLTTAAVVWTLDATVTVRLRAAPRR